MTQSLKIPKAEKMNFLDAAQQLDEAQQTNDKTLSTAGKTIENASSTYYRTVNTQMRNSVNIKTSA